MKFLIIAVHNLCHIDEIFAIWLLKRFGERKFPGIRTAKIIFEGTGGELINELSGDSLERIGTVCLGVGGGRFDEHPSLTSLGKSGECTSSLVAKELEVDKDPAISRILEFVKNNDLHGGSQPFDLAALTKAVMLNNQDNQEMVINWAIIAIEAKYQEQLQFLTSQEEFQQKAEIETISGPGEKPLTLVVIRSDNPQANKVARFLCSAGVVIQQKSSGNIQIYSNKKHRPKITMSEVVALIRTEEQKRSGKIRKLNPKQLRSEGKVEGSECWYYHKPAEIILNGSFSAPNTQPTKLSLKEIKDLVVKGISS